MRINRNNNIGPISSKKDRKKTDSSKGASSSASSDQLALNQVQSMVGDLISMPEVREDIVELGRKLAKDPSYPQEDVVDQVARILSKAINR